MYKQSNDGPYTECKI